MGGGELFWTGLDQFTSDMPAQGSNQEVPLCGPACQATADVISAGKSLPSERAV